MIFPMTETLKEIIIYCSEGLQTFLELISVLCVFIGLVMSLFSALKSKGTESAFIILKMRFGSWLSLALEFQLAADILATTINPGIDELIKLGIIAVIRTFLNYFLYKELSSEEKIKSLP